MSLYSVLIKQVCSQSLWERVVQGAPTSRRQAIIAPRYLNCSLESGDCTFQRNVAFSPHKSRTSRLQCFHPDWSVCTFFPSRVLLKRVAVYFFQAVTDIRRLHRVVELGDRDAVSEQEGEDLGTHDTQTNKVKEITNKENEQTNTKLQNYKTN